MSERSEAIGAILLFLVVGIVMFLGIKHVVENPQVGQPSSQVTEPEKPFTKTRCDLTGVMASSIIEDEAKNGYRFNGRIKTFLCGDNGLSFELKDQ